MTIKILCFHGMGLNADIFRAQSASFRALLPSSYEFKFFDGQKLCSPSPQIADFYPGPYRCWYDSPARSKVESAHRYVMGLAAEEKGGFDVVMGFSQGAALVASIVLYHQIVYPDQAPPFKAAIFICSPLPFSLSLDHGIDVRKYFGVDASQPLSPKRPTEVPRTLIPEPYFLQSSNESSNIAAASLSDRFEFKPSNFGNDQDEGGPFYNMFHPSIDTERISIPTAHVYGQKDPWRFHSLDLMALCKQPISFQHDGGHEIPRHSSEEICDTIEELIARAGLL